MGFDEKKFLTILTEEHKCPLCLGVLDNPMKLPCEHIFCSGCILPRIIQDDSCPMKCSKQVTIRELQNVLTLRTTILNMNVRCDHDERGCAKTIKLIDLSPHIKFCEYRPVSCGHKGCGLILNSKDIMKHQNQDCEFRPIGICQKGCELMLTVSSSANHDCIKALREHGTKQETKIASQERDLKKMASQYTKREKGLLARVASLHSEIQLQALKFQKKMYDYHTQLGYLKRNAKVSNNDEEEVEETRHTLTLHREKNSFGFTIMGGQLSDTSLSDGIVVSKVSENSAAEKAGMKLHDIIIKVNGQDLSKASHEDAVEAFKNAKEPIVVEVLRRISKSSSKQTRQRPASPNMISVSTQTDDYIENCYALLRPPTPPQGYMGFQDSRLYQPSSRQPLVFSPSTEMGLTDIEMSTEMMDDFYEEERSYEMEYEEVTLHRVTSEEKIGLTLCYGSIDENNTDIFIKEIEPYSIAAQDGRIREGDQILQINHQDVHSREQAIKLFSENKADISLHLARPQLQYDDGFMEDRNYYLDELQMDMLEDHHQQRMAFLHQLNDEEGGTTDTATTSGSHKHEKDSGVGRTDESTRNDESSEQEIFDSECVSPNINSKFGPGNMDLHCSNDSFASLDDQETDYQTHEISAEECDKFRQVLNNRCASVGNSPQHNVVNVINKNSSSHESTGSLDRELVHLDKEMQDIALECEQIVDKHLRAQHKVCNQSESLKTDSYRSPRLVPRMGIRSSVKHGGQQSHEFTDPWFKSDDVTSGTSTMASKDENKQILKVKSEEKGDSCNTSAYNTAESCRSTPLGLTLELNQASSESEKGHKGSMLCLNVESDKENKTKDTKVKKIVKQSTGTQSDSEGGVHMNESESLTDIYARCADVMYTNQANLAHTISVQQKLFEQQLMKRAEMQQQQNTTCRSRLPSVSSNADSTTIQSDNPESQMEWVVKKRADGTRYLTRRPKRNKILKDRAKKINDERAGMTTDDDAMSELKTGRYWSKEDRKRHVERAKDQKRRKEFMMRSRMETLKEQTNENDGRKEINIVELGHRKMMRHKGKRVFDDFTTVQEMLVHGSRVSEAKTYNPLLSVTTV